MGQGEHRSIRCSISVIYDDRSPSVYKIEFERVRFIRFGFYPKTRVYQLTFQQYHALLGKLGNPDSKYEIDGFNKYTYIRHRFNLGAGHEKVSS